MAKDLWLTQGSSGGDMEPSFDVAIAGELNLDLILYGVAAQMPTERELLGDDFVVTLGSSSAIVAHNLATLGARVSFQSVIGDDEFGVLAQQRLAKSGIDVSEIRKCADRKTGVTILLPHGSERHILTYPGTIADLRVADLDVSLLRRARHLHLCSLYLQHGLHKGLPELLKRLKENGLTVSLDPNDDPEDEWGAPLKEVLRFVDIFMPNESELCRIAGTDDFEVAIAQMAERVPTLVVKRGRRGTVIISGDERHEVPAITLPHVVDTIGAGDSFDAGFLRAILRGHDLLDAARAGNLAGALSTQGNGGTEAFRNSALREQFLRAHDAKGLLR